VTHRALLAAALLSILVAALAARPHAVPGPHLRDFEAYWAAGATWNAREDAYSPAIWNAERVVPGVDARRDEILPFVGPPATLLAWSLFARLPYATAASLWSAFEVAAAIALVAGVALGSHARMDLFTLAAVTALGLACAPVSSAIVLGQLALPAFAAAALLVPLASRSLFAAAAAAIIAFAQPNASLGLLSQLGRNRITIALACAALASYALGAVAAGWGWPAAYARIVAAQLAAERFDAIQLTPAAIAYGFGAAPAQARLIGLAVAALAIVAAVLIAIAVRGRFARFAAFSALVPFVAAFVHEHDLVVAAAAAPWCALRTRGATRAIALTGTLLLCVDWLGLAQRPSAAVQSALLLFAALAAFASLGETRELRAGAVIGAVVACALAAAVWLAYGHPAPIWPDALGSFQAPNGASAAAIWSQEQRATGLFAVNPAWAALRSAPLLGCALLAYAIYRRPSRCRTA